MSSYRIFAPGALLSLALLTSAQDAVPRPTDPTQKPAEAATPTETSAKPPVSNEAPADIYLRAMQPVEIVRRSPNNVTDSEVAAWGVAVVAAAHECAARKIDQFKGEDLFQFARLCLLGQQYEDAYDAAAKYIWDGNTTSAESARALIVRAHLASGNLLRAERDAYELMRNHPYDGTVHTMVQEVVLALAAKDALESALQMVARRSEPLMAALRAGGGLQLHEGTYRVPQATLVRDALTAVYFYRAENRINRAQDSAQALLDAMRPIVNDSAASASPLERDAMLMALRRAEMLMGEAPALTIEASTLPKPAPAVVSYEKNITVLVFYAPWLPQRSQIFDLLTAMSNDYKTFPVQFFAVSSPAIATGNAAAKPTEVLTQLLEQFKSGNPVPVVVASEAASQAFGVDDWPMFAVIDRAGKVRYLDTITGSELKDGGRMHRLVAALASQAGPNPVPPPAPAKGKTGRVKVPEGTLQRRPK